MNEPNNHFPVNALIDKSLHIFQTFGDTGEIQFYQKKGLSNRIKVVISDGPITNAAECALHYDEENNPFYQIAIWDNFCQYLWAICYVSSVVMDECIIKPFNTPDVHVDDELLFKSFELLNAGMSLFADDDKQRASRGRFFELPNPIYNPENEDVKTTNTLFVGCMCFILFHEYHHFTLGHMQQQGQKKSDEYAADYAAFFSMYESKPLEIRKSVSLSIIQTLGAILLIDDTLDGGETHPDPDDRLGYILSCMDDLDPQGIDYCYGMAATIYKLWAFYYSKTALIPKVKEAADMKAYFQIIQQAVANSKQA